MTELTGTLEGVGLPAIVRFLAGLHKTGALRITHQDWRGEVFLDAGRVVSAQLGSRTGLSALDALVQALPGGSFVFDSDAGLPEKANVELTQNALLAHLEELTVAAPLLPSLESVPNVVAQDEDASADDTVPLDRGTLQTLLAIDGQRTIREIIGARGSFEALWQVANLVQVGLVRISEPAEGRKAVLPEPKPIEPPVEPKRVEMRQERRATPLRVAPRPRTGSVEVAKPAAAVAMPVAEVAKPVEVPTPRSVEAPAPAVAASTAATATSCPKLGFEDDPGSSFARPTRLHRCFAAGAPLPLSLDQQRELCLSDQYGTCPRLAMAGIAPSDATVTSTVVSGPAVEETETTIVVDDPRIVRLPVGGRGRPAVVSAPAEAPAAAGEKAAPVAQPTPLRARPVRNGASAATAVAEPVVTPPTTEDAGGPKAPVIGGARKIAAALHASPPSRHPILNLPSTTIAGAAVVLIVIAVVGALLAPRMGELFTDEQGVDLSALPNSSAAAAGTPVAELPAVKPTAAAAAALLNSTPAEAAAAAPTTAPAAPVAPANVPAGEPTAAPVVQPQPTSAPVAAGPRTLVEETFDDNSRNWPNNPQGTAWLTGGSYRIAPRQAGQFVAVSVPPIGEILQDVVLSGTFRKVGGPAGGGYGFIVRDQGPGPRDGVNQVGRYYVLEVGDKGEIGIWRREGDRWVDLLPWQRSDAVRPGNATNELTVRAVGDRLSLSVNGTEVGFRTDGTLAVGNVGIFVGGDGNSVAVDQLSVRTP